MRSNAGMANRQGDVDLAGCTGKTSLFFQRHVRKIKIFCVKNVEFFNV